MMCRPGLELRRSGAVAVTGGKVSAGEAEGLDGVRAGPAVGVVGSGQLGAGRVVVGLDQAVAVEHPVLPGGLGEVNGPTDEAVRRASRVRMSG